MWLDMYMNKRIHMQLQTKTDAVRKLEIELWETIKEVKIEHMYWRKCNAIHNWLVENIQDWEDNCSIYHFWEDQIIELLDIINKILKDNTLAEELLPMNIIRNYID